MADKQKLTKGKRAVPYSKKKAPAKKTANEEPADEQYVDIDHDDYTEKDWKVVPRPGREKGRRETVVPQPSASALPFEVPEEEEEVIEEGEIVPGVEGTGTFHYSSLDELLDSVEADSWFPCPIHITQVMEERKSKKETCTDVFLRYSVSTCPVFCPAQDYQKYYDLCRAQGHDWFTLDRIDRMVCECGRSPTLSISMSEKNRNRMYLRCAFRECDLFAWWNTRPFKKTQEILMAHPEGSH